ncbi:MAG: CPBP family intramembrane glutamic endopeptidase [Propionicimonas sp.]
MTPYLGQVPYQSPLPEPSLPIVAREYHEFYRAPRFRWWKPLAAVGLLIAVMFLLGLAIGLVAILDDVNAGRITLEEALKGAITPGLFLANNIVLASAIPVALGAHWLVFRQRPGWLLSIQGRFRWRLLGRLLLAAAPLYLVSFGIEALLSGGLGGLSWRPESAFMMAVVLLTTPLQSAGEEVAMRGLLARCVGSWFSARRVGLVVATTVSAVVFMLLHGAGDIWLNVFYLSVAVAMSVLAWKTGGLEAPIALHVVNNLASMITLPFTDLTGVFNREAGVGSPWVLVNVAIALSAAAAILWQARRLGLPTTAAPAAHSAAH